MILRLCWITIVAFSVAVSARVYQDVSEVADLDGYDFIVVGAGTAGNVVAARLSEDPSVRVLVIESGVTDENLQSAIVPFFCVNLTPPTPWSWNFTTVPQSGLNGRSLSYPRGKLLGGSSSINYMIYTRGSSDDYNRYAEISGDEGWSWDALQPYIHKHEQLITPADGRDISDEVDPAVHGTDGPLEVSVAGYVWEIDHKVVATAEELPEFPFNRDQNSGSPLGVGWGQLTITDNGTRSSSSTAYLHPALSSRDNLDLLLQTHVTKVVANQTGYTTSFNGVEVAQSSEGQRQVLHAKKEVILSAGTVNTPQILLLSGIGDAEALQTLGIEPLIDLPAVGQNLQDHPLLANSFYVNSTNTVDSIRQNQTLFDELYAQYNSTQTGPFVDSTSDMFGFYRLPEDSPLLQQYSDPSAGPLSSHYESIYSPGFTALGQTRPAAGNFITIVTIVASPHSRGSITINSTDPFDPPVIDPALLEHPFDLGVMVEAQKAARRFLTASPWTGYVQGAFGDLANSTGTDTDFEAHARDHTVTVFHPVGTAAMSAEDSEDGVVNPDLKVKKTEGLRIVDASVLPHIPGAHTQAPVYIIAERAADLIKEEWNLA